MFLRKYKTKQFFYGHNMLTEDVFVTQPSSNAEISFDEFVGLRQISVSWQVASAFSSYINPLKPTGYVMHQQFNIQQLYALPTLYLRVLYLSENKQRLVPLTA